MTTQEFQLKKMGLAIKAMFGLAAIVASFALLIQSTSPAVADAPETTYEAGRYQMELTSVYNASTKNIWWYIIAYDSSTGRSKFYYGSSAKGTNGASPQFQLPSSPL